MSESKGPARPSQVTMAGWLAVIGSSLILVTLFDAMSRVRSLEIRDAVTEFLSEPPGNGLGITADQAIEGIRVLMFVAGAATAAALVLAVFVLQRDNRARVGFTIAAALVLLTAPVSGFMALLLAFSAGVLWTRPARDWFAGREPVTDGPSRDHRTDRFRVQRPESSDRPSDSDTRQERVHMSDQNQSSDRPGPPPTHGFGDASGQGSHPQSQQYPQPYPQPYSQGYPPQHSGQSYGQSYGQGGHDPDKRPTTVTVAVWITWVVSALTVAAFALVALMLVVAPDEFNRQVQAQPQFQDAGISLDNLIAALWVGVAIVTFWCLAAIVLGAFAFRRANWARITLVVSAAMALLFSLFAFPAGLFNTIAAGAVIALLFTGGANPWYSRRNAGAYSGYPGQESGQWQGQYESQYGQPYPPPYDPYAGQYGQHGQYPGHHGEQYGGQYGQPSQYGQPDPYSQQGQPPYGQQPQQDRIQEDRAQYPYGQPPSSEQHEESHDDSQPDDHRDDYRDHHRDDRQDPPKNVW